MEGDIYLRSAPRDVFDRSAGRLEINVAWGTIFRGEALRATFFTAPQIVLRSAVDLCHTRRAGGDKALPRMLAGLCRGCCQGSPGTTRESSGTEFGNIW